MTYKLSTAELRKRNRSNVYHFFYQADAPKTKQDVVQALTLSLPTVTQNLQELLENGLIEDAGLTASTGGRRARALRLSPHAKFAAGLSLSPEGIQLIAIDLKANEIAYQQIDSRFSNERAYWKELSEAVEDFFNAFSLDREKLLGIGITLPGVVDDKNGMIETAPVLGIRRMQLSLLTEMLPYPAAVENDASAAGYAEWWNRSGQNSMAYLFLGKGVGGALLIDGKPYAGANHRSGEFGHMCIVPDGALCRCGQQGCLEAYCSVSRLTDDLGIPLDVFFHKLSQGEETCFKVWQSYVDHLATGIHSIRMALDCDVVLGGLLTPYLPAFLPDLRAKLRAKNPFGEDGGYLQLGKCGSKSNCIGAALHFVDEFLHKI